MENGARPWHVVGTGVRAQTVSQRVGSYVAGVSTVDDVARKSLSTVRGYP